jgi:hypothetical protein
MNPISQINQYCQAHSLPFPEYTFYGSSESWYCSTTWDAKPTDNPTCWQSKSWTTKKAAKEDVAKQIVTTLPTTQDESRVLPSALLLLIDGDQRMDCWKWLTKCSWDDSTHITIFISPTCPIVESNKPINIIKSKTTNRDSSDAIMLISLGKILASNLFKYHRIVIVSSDHILVQAAQDLGLTYAANLASLIDIVDSMPI